MGLVVAAVMKVLLSRLSCLLAVQAVFSDLLPHSWAPDEVDPAA